MRPVNLCRPCGQDFTSLVLFDRHLVGRVAAGIYRGSLWEWEPHLGIRCLGVDEMEERGWRRDRHGRWQDPRAVERARRRLRARMPEIAMAFGLEGPGRRRIRENPSPALPGRSAREAMARTRAFGPSARGE